MKDLILLLSFWLVSNSSFCQDSSFNAELDTACTCLTEATKMDNKVDFEFKFSQCLDSLFISVQRLNPVYNDVKKLNALIHVELKNSCGNFQLIDSLHNFYSTHAFEILATKEDCSCMKSGTFVTYGDADSTLIIMTETKQVLKFKSGAYTKSKVEWIDSCSYNLIRIKSTDPYEQQMVPKGEVRRINIILVNDAGTIFYEIIAHGNAYAGRLIKIKD